MDLKPLLTLLLLLALIPSAAAEVETLTVTPDNPEVGDVLEIYILAEANEALPITLTFERDLDVSMGKYILNVNDLEIPDPPNHFIVEASPVQDLTVSILNLNSGTTKPAINDVAVVSTSDFMGGAHEIRIQGKPKSGASTVSVKITAGSTRTADSNGEFEYDFPTTNIPAGDYTIKVNSHTLIVTVSEPGGSSGGSSGGLPPVILPPILREPVADVSHPENSVTGVPITFDASPSSDPDGIIVSYTWDIGGSTYSGVQVTQTFNETGSISVSLTVVDSLGRSSTYTGTVNIADASLFIPIADAGSSRKGFTGQTITFDASASISHNSEITLYHWDFGDESTGQGVRVSHNYSAPGEYSVELSVTNDRGVVGTDSVMIHIDELPGTTFQDEQTVNQSRGILTYPDVGVTVELNATGEVKLLVFRYEEGSFDGETLPERGVDEIIDLSVSDPDAVEWPLYVEFTYDAPGLDESRLGLYVYLNGTWRACGETGVDAAHGIVWAYLTQIEVSGSPVTVAEINNPAVFVLGQISVTPLEPEIGEEVTINIPYSNSGDLFGELLIVIAIDGDSELVASLGLEGNSETTYTHTMSFDEAGEYLVRVQGENILVNVKPRLADLTVEVDQDTQAISAGEDATIQVTVINIGEAAAPESYVTMEVNGQSFETKMVDALEPGGERIVSFQWTPEEAGAYSLTFSVDPGGFIEESSEDNNAVLSEATVESRPVTNPTNLLLAGVAVLVVALFLARDRIIFALSGD